MVAHTHRAHSRTHQPTLTFFDRPTDQPIERLIAVTAHLFVDYYLLLLLLVNKCGLTKTAAVLHLLNQINHMFSMFSLPIRVFPPILVHVQKLCVRFSGTKTTRERMMNFISLLW